MVAKEVIRSDLVLLKDSTWLCWKSLRINTRMLALSSYEDGIDIGMGTMDAVTGVDQKTACKS